MSTKNRKWKPGQLEKFRATMAARAKTKVVAAKKKKAKSGTKVGLSGKPVGSSVDAILYLEAASDHIHTQLTTGRLKKMDRAHNLAMLALSTLKGE